MYTDKTRTSSIYFLYSYAPLKHASSYCNDHWGYLLIDHQGNLLKIFSTRNFKERCARLGIVKGISFLSPKWTGTAISEGFHAKKTCQTKGKENAPAVMKEMTVVFSPIILNVSGLKDSPAYVRPCSIDADTFEGKYGGVSILAFPECEISALLPLADAIANQIFVQLHWFNTEYLDYGTDCGFIALFQPEGRQQMMMLSKNIWSIFKIPDEQTLFREPLNMLIDPLPKNKEFWDIIDSQRVVKDVVLSIERNGSYFEIGLSTVFHEEPHFFEKDYILLIQSRNAYQKIRDQIISSSTHYTFDNMVRGNSEKFRRTLADAEMAAKTSANILLMGESGTGKDVLAQAIHNASPRNNQPFVAINCASFSRELIASELFGYEPGAFTGAKKNGAIGKFEVAKHGTLFLDEIGDIPLDIQAMLLRVLEERKFMKVGGTKEIEVDTRIIAATNKPLMQMVKQGLFREDLYYRLSVVNIHIPSLRERSEDILHFANYYVNTICARQGKPIIFLTDAAKTLMTDYRWPGNIRELRNLLEGIISTTNNSQITEQDVLSRIGMSDDAFLNTDKAAPLSTKSDDENTERKKLVTRKTSLLNRQSILDALQTENNNISRAAERLGVSKRTLYRKLHEFGLMQ